MLGHTVMRPIRRFVLSAFAFSTIGCGQTLQSKAEAALTGCVALRNPLFKAGQAEQALALPLPAEVDALANATAYNFGFRLYRVAAESAETQAELTCALELASHYKNVEVQLWLAEFLRHPNPPVAAHAKRLLDKQLAKLSPGAGR